MRKPSERRGASGLLGVLDELTGIVPSSASPGNFGVHALTAGSYALYEMWVSLSGAASSSELTVEFCPASHGYLGSTPNPSGQIGSTANFTDSIVSTTHPQRNARCPPFK
ncbi:MAG: hypothetical protein ACT4O2_13770 [Beijerinckiaceae bacterium]